MRHTDKALALVGENMVGWRISQDISCGPAVHLYCGCNSFGRVLAFQARSSRFETCHPHQRIKAPLRRGFFVPENP